MSGDLTGSRLAHFDLAERLGRGGMGEVYKARDSRLGRDVAIKVLPETWLVSRDRLDRFEREARLLGSLSHAGIAALFDVGEHDGTHFLVMELVAGETLAHRIARGPLPIAEVVRIATEITRAVEAAHARGVIHRDLKPANVMVGPEGQVKILDFGLAKALAVPDATELDAPTRTSDGTAVGLILGTPAYMSPEQTRGEAVDGRTDVWALGCLLYEMLTGRRPFDAPTTAQLAAAVLTAEPDWSVLPTEVPRGLVRLLKRCLAKDPRDRLHHIADARLELSDTLRDESAGSTRTVLARRRPAIMGLAGLLLGAGATWLATAGVNVEGPAAQTSRWSIDTSALGQLDQGQRQDPLAIAPDGRMLAYVVRDAGGTTRLYTRPIDALDPRLIPGSEGASNPFFSPDGRSVGFFAGNRLKTASVGGGAPIDLAVVPLDNLGATWGPNGTIVFASYASGLWSVADAGGEAELLTARGTEGVEQHRWPSFLPDGHRVLFVLQTLDGPRLAVFDLETLTHELVPGGQEVIKARYLPSGHLVFAQVDTLLAVPFDPEEAALLDAPVTVLSGLSTDRSATADFEVSAAGTLVYLTGSDSDGVLTWVDRDGTQQVAVDEPARYTHPRLSPDGRRLAVEIGSEVGVRHLEIFDLRRGTRTVITADGRTAQPVWYPDSERLAIGSDLAGNWDLYSLDISGPNMPDPLFVEPLEQWLGSFTPDASKLVFYQVDPLTARDVWVLDVAQGTARPYRATPANERGVRLSPSGRWLAYVSNESTRDEVYVDSFPDPGRRWTVSSSGGREPVWSPDGGELYYREGSRMMAVTVSSGDDLAPSPPEILFEGSYIEEVVGNANFDVAEDGRFLMIHAEQAAARRFQVVLNWTPTPSGAPGGR